MHDSTYHMMFVYVTYGAKNNSIELFAKPKVSF